MEPTVWAMYECQHGARWTETTGFGTAQSGEPCVFSGCAPGHTIERKGQTTDHAKAAEWFRRPTEATA